MLQKACAYLHHKETSSWMYYQLSKIFLYVIFEVSPLHLFKVNLNYTREIFFPCCRIQSNPRNKCFLGGYSRNMLQKSCAYLNRKETSSWMYYQLSKIFLNVKFFSRSFYREFFLHNLVNPILSSRSDIPLLLVPPF
jgi:hypothetical protein